MARLTHTLETLFDAMREDRLTPTQAVTDTLLATVDAFSRFPEWPASPAQRA